MVTTQEVKAWVKHRIDYWESKFESQDLPEDYEDVEGRGQLAAFYMVREFIDGQRR